LEEEEEEGGGGETKEMVESGAARRARPGTMGTLFFHRYGS